MTSDLSGVQCDEPGHRAEAERAAPHRPLAAVLQPRHPEDGHVPGGEPVQEPTSAEEHGCVPSTYTRTMLISDLTTIQIHCNPFIATLAQELRAIVWQLKVTGSIPSLGRVNVPLSKTPKPQSLPTSWVVPCMAA